MLRCVGGVPPGAHAFFAYGSDEAGLKKAASVLRSGGIVAFPTETVYGLGADACDPKAVAKVYHSKGRPGDNPLILHVNDMESVQSLTSELSDVAKNLIQTFWPGPLTLVLVKNPALPDWMGGHPDGCMKTIAVRSASHPVTRALIKESGCVIAAPSANKAGKPSPTQAAHVLSDFSIPGEIDFLLDGGEVDGGLESTVVDMTGEIPCILRPGAVTLDMLRDVIGSVQYNESVSGSPRSPGQKYKHYAPKANMTVVRGTPDEIANTICSLTSHYKKTGILATAQTESRYGQFKPNVIVMGNRDDLSTVAHNLYACLRRFDEMDVNEIYAEAVPETGLGRAIMNRMLKAAEGRVLNG